MRSDAKNNQPLISVVIPVYNGGNLLRCMLDSVVVQTERSFEVLLIDDGSSDDTTLGILDFYAIKDARLKVIHQTNIGVERTRDKGISLAKGEWVYVCDQDDYLHPRLFEFALWACNKYKLDFLKIKHQFGSIASTEKLDAFDNFSVAHIDVIDNKLNDGAYIGKMLRQLHPDLWAQFTKRELASAFSCAKMDVARVFHIVTLANRWGLSEVPLYYYHGDIADSMIHQAIKPSDVEVLHNGWRNVYDFYASRAVDDHGREIFRNVCEGQIADKLKVILHMIKRLNKLNNAATRIRVWKSFGEMLWDFIFIRSISIKMTGAKRYLEYLAIALFSRIKG